MLNTYYDRIVGQTEISFVDGSKRMVNLYANNGLMACVYLYEKDGQFYDSLANFFLDEGHAKNVFGLGSKKSGYDKPYFTEGRYRLNLAYPDNVTLANIITKGIAKHGLKISLELYYEPIKRLTEEEINELYVKL